MENSKGRDLLTVRPSKANNSFLVILNVQTLGNYN